MGVAFRSTLNAVVDANHLDRTGALVLSAPPAVDETTLRDFVQRKRMWVYRQLARQAALGQQPRRKTLLTRKASRMDRRQSVARSATE
jgi:predicted metal-dependent hydrolase